MRHRQVAVLQITEAVFAVSCFLQWWLVYGADRMFDCLKWAGNPSGSLPIRAARSLVLSTAHKLTWLGATSIPSHSQLPSILVHARPVTAAFVLKYVSILSWAAGALVPGRDA